MLIRFFLLLTLLCSSAHAGQSSLFKKVSFNSFNTFSDIISGIWGFEENATANLTFAHARTPIPVVKLTDTYYYGSAGLSYGADKLAFDISGSYSKSPLARLTTIGGSVGLTFIYIPESDTEKDFSKHSLEIMHHQIYPPGEAELPLFWARMGYNGNVSRSKALDESEKSGKETSLTFDLSVPLSYDFLVSSGVGFYDYDDSNKFYTNATGEAKNLDQAFLGSTILGLPKASFSSQFIWQITPLDVFMPRYQTTMNSSSGLWSHTGSIGWRHLFFSKLYFTPSYESTYGRFGSVGGFSLTFLYML